MTPAQAADAWAFAVDRHARPRVEPALHRLQDGHGQSVLLLLYAAWLARAGRTADMAAAAAIIRAWTEAAVAPLRAVRRTLKTADLAGEPTLRQALRGQVLGLELEAERMMLAALPSPGAAAAADLKAALAAAATAWDGAPPSPALRAALQDAAGVLAD